MSTQAYTILPLAADITHITGEEAGIRVAMGEEGILDQEGMGVVVEEEEEEMGVVEVARS